MSGHHAGIAALLDTYAEAAAARDVDAFMAMYHPQVRVFDTWGVWSHDGAGAWRQAIEGWFGGLGRESVRVTFDDVQVMAGQPLAMLSAFATYTGLSAEGAELRSMQNRLTWVLSQAQGEWKIVHEHTSVPVGLGDAKAMLHRPAPQ